MAGLHVSGEKIGSALESAALNPSSETYVEDLAEVVHAAAADDVKNQIREVTDQMGRELDRIQVAVADPDREVERYLRLRKE